MKAKNLFLIFILLMLFLSFPCSVLAADENADGYDDNDFNKIQAFLEQTSSDGIRSNGLRASGFYNSNNPLTWAGVAWTVDNPKRVESIMWLMVQGLAGQLDLSDCNYLSTLFCLGQSINSLNLNGTESLTNINVSDNELTSLEIDSNPFLVVCSKNKLQGKLDLSGNPYLLGLHCDHNDLISIDITGCENLENLVCNDNNISGALDVSKAVKLTTLYCHNNQLSGLKLSEKCLNRLNTSNNKIKNISMDMFAKDQTFTANGDGYISLNMNIVQDHFILNAETASDILFDNWTSEGVEVSEDLVYYLNYKDPPTQDITANFKSILTADPSDGVIYTGGRLTLTSLLTGGTWQYDTSLLQVDLSDPEKPVFKGLKPGKTQISYTIENGINDITSVLDVTIKASRLPVTGQNFTFAILLALAALIATAIIILIKRKNKHA